MAGISPSARAAAGLSLVASMLWASYYYFVLTLSPAARPPSILAYPFFTAGAGFLLLSAAQGSLSKSLRLWTSPSAWLRSGLLAAMQVSVLAGTYTAGPVDTSLLSLLGDVAVTPVLLMVLYREGRDRARTPTFLGGLFLSCAGATLTIVGGASAAPVRGLAWLVVAAVPLTVAFYFLLTARSNREVPIAAVVAQASIAAGVISLAISPLLPGGAGGLAVASVHDAGLLAVLGLTSFLAAQWVYFKAVERAGLLLPALLMATIPLFTLLFEVVAFGEHATLLALLGVPVAVAGGFLAVQGSHPGWTPTYAEGPPKPS